MDYTEAAAALLTIHNDKIRAGQAAEPDDAEPVKES